MAPRLAPLSDQRSLQERTYQALREALLEGQYLPGQRIYESELAGLLAVSRNPVREAVRRLQQDGLLDVKPRGGIFVASVPAAEVEDVYRIRGALEGTAAALAAERMTKSELQELGRILRRGEQNGRAKDRRGAASATVARADHFHHAIHQGAHSQRLSLMLELIYAQVMHFRNLTLRMPGRAHAVAQGHTELYSALMERNAAEAERLMRQHVDGARLMLMRHLDGVDASADSQDRAVAD
jgi:DNA-binding GntR family transcriptional regulator